ncbi:uncharacterized protein PAN0_016d5259 [Moesziomyces antarcticus]|uniref:Uncharacterized protein n=2 Tax=Pseudozyma antarctica TaxID=84753 RepID=A0A5C3FXT7_PSEA2|nr:uncharacterized protein PAN0_016d5259 [Moesziomyces antarcticus]GAK67033.1 conserved hypothetical protein [Moesziomyces antarcticus]SPO48279.1 uncharacterized protein PSANT_05968 [Moesziomyces antarcticus]
MLAAVLAPLAAVNARLAQPVHATLYPFPLATTLHALRVALAYRGLCAAFTARRRAEGKTAAELRVSWLRDLAGFLVMAWGGSFLANHILGQIPGQLLAAWPWANYISVYLAVTLALSVAPAPSAKLLDLTLPVLDGATRTAATYGGINMVLNHANPAARNSLLLQVIVATVSACGGGISAFTLNVFDPLGWSLSTPPFLNATSLVQLTDIVAPALAAAVFGVLTLSHPSYASVLAHIHHKPAALLSHDGGKAVISLVIGSCFFVRAIVMHVLTPAPAPARPIAANKAIRSAAKKN